jgi:hypothetical protein
MLSPRRIALAIPLAVALSAACSSTKGLGGDDADGLQGGAYTFVVTVSDTEFAPAILKTENLATITLTLQNDGKATHGFVVDEISGARASVPPGQKATISFTTPAKEGIYTFRSTEAGDAFTGQLIIQ